MKEIKICSQEKLYKRMKIYNSFLFKKVLFKTDLDDVACINIVNALNIKNKMKKIEYIYNTACDEIDNFYKDKNICQFNSQNKCINQQKNNSPNFNGCCMSCINQSNNGCTTCNLSCKFFYCDIINKKYKVLKIKDISILKLLTLRQRIILKQDFFSSKKQILRDLYIGSILIFEYTIGIRTFINYLKFNKLKKKGLI